MLKTKALFACRASKYNKNISNSHADNDKNINPLQLVDIIDYVNDGKNGSNLLSVAISYHRVECVKLVCKYNVCLLAISLISV